MDRRLAASADEAKRKQVEAERAHLLLPIAEIFEKELRPHLFNLPARDQLKHAMAGPEATGALAP